MKLRFVFSPRTCSPRFRPSLFLRVRYVRVRQSQWTRREHQALFDATAVIVVGVSTGGPAALDVLLSAIPQGFPLPILVVQHMPELFTGPLAERLSQRCSVHVREAAECAPVIPGVIYLARGNWHMEVLAATHGGSPPTLHLHQGPPENHCRPAVDVLFRSAAHSLVRLRWLSCSQAWARTVWPLVESFARREAPFLRRIKPPALSGACPVR